MNFRALAPSLFWGEKRLARTPSIMKARSNETNRNTKMFANFRHAPSNSVDSDDAICPFISTLPDWSRPNAVGEFVIPIVINTLDGPSCFPWTHVIEETYKRSSPAIAHCDITPAVVPESCEPWVCASLNHVPPNCKGLRRATVDEQRFAPEASARRRGSGSERVVSDKCPSTTVADTVTRGVMRSRVWVDVVRAGAKHGPSCKSSSRCDRVSGRHSVGSFNVVFSGGRPASTGARCNYYTNHHGGCQ